MRGMMPIIAFGLVAAWGFMVLLGLGGVAFAGYWLYSSESSYSFRKGSNTANNTVQPVVNQGKNKLGGGKAPTITQPNFPNVQPNFPNVQPNFPNVQPNFPPVGGGNTGGGLDVNSNSNSLFNSMRGQLSVSASSRWSGWEETKVIDGNANTTWFPLTGGVNQNEGPWLLVTLPQETTIRRFTVLGNRDPTWKGYGMKQLKVEFLDRSGKVLKTHVGPPVAGGDFDFPNLNYAGVKQIRVTCVEDITGRKGAFVNAAISELQAE